MFTNDELELDIECTENRDGSLEYHHKPENVTARITPHDGMTAEQASARILAILFDAVVELRTLRGRNASKN